MKIFEDSPEIYRIQGQGYATLISYHGWRVAAACFAPHLTPERLPHFEKHLKTDEVFIPIRAGGLLYLAGRGEKPGEISVHPMSQGEICNVRCGIWHAISLEPESRVVIVEDDDTSEDNTLRQPLEEWQRKSVIQLAREVMEDR